MKKMITRKLISTQISKLLNKEISVSDFGEEMFQYLAFDEDYDYEEGYKELIMDVLDNFTQMHDAGKENPGYKPDIPSNEKLIELRDLLNK